MQHVLFILLGNLLMLSQVSLAQSGCTDPQAMNFDAIAVQNDGSCQYPTTSYNASFLSNLGSELREISGLTYANLEWWAHNDSGSNPEFFSIDPQNGTVLKKIDLKDAHNRDWEDVAADTEYLYLGDFGNNNNNRQNLGIYRVPFSAIGNGNNQNVASDEYSFLPFAYPDQFDFSSVVEDSTEFDCEAMVVVQGKLHLFSKNRKKYQTTHYAIDPTNNNIQKIETFDCQGLITGASVSPDGKTIALVGYDLRGLPTVFSWLLWDWQAGTDHFFSGNKRRIELGSAFSVGQVESIGFYANRLAFFANERTEYGGILFVPQRVWGIDFSAWLPKLVPNEEPSDNPKTVKIYPNPSSGVVYLEGDVADPERVFLQLFSPMGGKIAMQGLPHKVDLSQAPKGMYVLHAFWSDGSRSAQTLVLH